MVGEVVHCYCPGSFANSERSLLLTAVFVAMPLVFDEI